MKRIIPVIIFLLSLGKSFAQLNESDTLKYQLRATLTGNFQSGNVNLTVVRSKLDFTFSPHRDWVFKTQNSSLYQSFAAKADNDIFSRNYLYFKAKNTIYPFGIAYISTNYRRKIDSRFFVGAGATWRIVKNENTSLKLSAGTVYESTRFNGSDFNFAEYKGSNEINVWRGTFYSSFSSFILEKRLRIFYEAFWQPAFDNRNNYRTEVDFGLEFPVYKGLSFNVLYGFSHENVVTLKEKQDDRILTFGVGYNLKKR